MILEQLSQLARKHQLRLNIILGGAVFLFIMALGLYQPPRVVVHDERVVPEYTFTEALRVPSFSNVALMTKITVEPVKIAVKSLTAPSGWYSPYECTGYVASKRPVGQWHDAVTWPVMAKAEGYYVGSVPKVGAIGQRGNHVVFIEKLTDDQVYISERNWDYNGSYREMWRPIDYYTYIY